MRSVGLALLKPGVHSSTRAALGGTCTAEAKLGAQQLRVDDDDAGREQQLRHSSERRMEEYFLKSSNLRIFVLELEKIIEGTTVV
jgi:hypothetical protein